jgi:Tfp pilus assembly protein PilZ
MEAVKSIPLKEINISAVTARIIEIVLAMPIDERRTLLKYLEEEHISGRRKYPRRTYFMEVSFATPDRVINGYIKNISSDGMFVETREPFSVGQHITLTFKLPNSVEHIKVNGEIVRVSYKGFGVKFRMKLDDSVKSREKNLR